MKTKFPLWQLLLLLFLPGCGATLSSRFGPPADEQRNETLVVHGMPYFLPIGVITIKGEWNKPKSEGNGKDPISGQGAREAEKPSPPVGGTASGNSVSVAIENWVITIMADIEADPAARYYAVPWRNYIFDDEYQVTVNSKHLLSAGNATANDRTADVIGSVASLAASTVGLRMMIPPLPPGEDQQPFLVSFRTNNPTEFKTARDVLKKRHFVLEPLAQPRVIGDLTQKELKQGLVFRLAEPYELTLRYPNNAPSEEKMSYNHVFVLPGIQPYVLDYGRVAFVKKVQNYGFTDGMLSDYHETLPSPILGVLGIPKAIVGAIVPLIGGGSLGGSASPPAASTSPTVTTP